MTDTQLPAILQMIANERIPPETVDLWPRVKRELDATKPQPYKPISRPLTRVALPIIIILVILTSSLILVGPESALAALRELLGYIPGVGLVDEGAGLRVLDEPISLTRDGITVTVEQAVLDSQQTVIIYSADGIPPEAFPRDVAEQPRGQTFTSPAECSSAPYLRLPNGTELQVLDGGGTGWASGYQERFVYVAIPPEISEAAYFIPCLEGTSPGAAPENWELALRFVPAPPDLTIVPVLEITATPEASVASDEAEDATGLYLEKVIELDDSYILSGTFRQGPDLPGEMVQAFSTLPEIVDADGQPLPYVIPSDLDMVWDEAGRFPWAYQIPKGFSSPLRITLTAVGVELPTDATFQLDVGAAPLEGQEWYLDHEFDLSGHAIHLVSAVRLAYGYEFTFTSDAAVSGIILEDVQHEPSGGFGGRTADGFTAGFEYAKPLPAGLLTFRITGLVIQQGGPWILRWEPQAGGEPAPTRVVPQACLTLAGWKEALESGPPQPEAITGKLIAYGKISEDGQALSPANAGIFVVNLEDGSRQVLGAGTWPSLSPDGTRAAYSGPDGLHIVNLDSGRNRVIAGTTDFDYNPRWSPDGTRLAFVRINDLNIYIVNADGSGMQRVTSGPEYELLVDWLPGGQTLAYVFPAPTGLQFRFVDLANGATLDGFVINAKVANVGISPDGLRIAFVERVEGGMDLALYVAQLNGSDRHLVAQLGQWALSNPRWSPDGSWLSIGITNTDTLGASAVTALINPDTCEVVSLAGVEGYVQDWSQ
jgi:hypothetical protein